MVWIVEKKVVYHLLSLAFERVNIPIRTTFEFEIKEGTLVPDSLSASIIYNRKAIERRYSGVNVTELEGSINKTVKKAIHEHLHECGYLKEKGD